MAELTFIVLQFFIIFFTLYFNPILVDNKFASLKKISLIEKLGLSLIIFFNIILFFSFLNLELIKIIYIYLFYLIIVTIISIYKYKYNYLINKKDIPDLIILFLISIMLYFEVANNLVIGWDAANFWIYKTLNFFNGNTIQNLSNLPNSWYPYLGTLSWAFFWKLSFLDNEYAGRLFYIFLHITSLMLLLNNLKINYFQKKIILILFVLLTYNNNFHSSWSIYSGHQEIVIFSLINLAIHFLLKLKNENFFNQNYILLAILLIFNSLIWIKQEGIIFSSILVLSLILFFKLKTQKKIFIFSTYLIFLFIRFFIFDFYDLNSAGHQHVGFRELSLNTLIEKITFERYIIIIKLLLFYLLTNYLILIGIIFSFLIFFKKKLFKKNYYIFFIFIVSLITFTFLYLLADSEITMIVETSMERIIFQISPFAILFFIEYINSLKISK
tara:strand:+ start:211 stop:1536 length:1326 start_codon:yes stop_codon:yes gene_type:complete